MNKVSIRLISLILLSLLAITACNPTPTPQPSSNLEETNAILTASAKKTQSAFETVVAQLTALSQNSAPVSPQEPPGVTTSPPPTATRTSTPTITRTPTETKTPQPTNTPTHTETVIPCNRVTFIEDVSIPPGTIMHPGDPFTKTWRIKNTGTCSWTEGFEVVFTDGERMGGVTPIRLGRTVIPNDLTDITIQMLSPRAEGVYAGLWQLKDDSGQIVGEGTQYQTPLWVNITVTTKIRELDPEKLLDLVHNYCAANWFSTAGYLGCPGPQADFISGSVIRHANPVLEGGHKDDEPAIVVVPSSGSGGLISGRYPGIEIQNGDRFESLVGCMDGRPNCSVTFQLDYREVGGTNVNLGTWKETSDDSYTRIEVPLYLLAGKTVEFTLTVNNDGNSTDDEVFWMVPKIERP